ncbi:hypothetical protein OQA88_845 [Cercophora sp. LCS_1]
MSTSAAASIRCSLMRSPYWETVTKLRDGFVAVLIGLFAQLLLAGIQSLLNRNDVDFPPSVLAMVLVFVTFLLCGCFLPGVDGFYKKQLLPAANLMNRHMSIGFTIPFVMVCRIVTGIINTVTAYGLALPMQTLLTRWENCSAALACLASSPEPEPTQQSRTPCKYIEDSPLSTFAAFTPSSSRPSTPTTTTTSAVLSCLLAHPLLLLLWTLTMTFGLPLRVTHTSTIILPTLLLVSLWLTTLTIQSILKTTQLLSPRIRTLLASLANPVLFTSLLMIAYASVESAVSKTSLHTILDNLQTHTALSDLIITRSAKALAAGDIALSVLNAGLVSWGLKLYEYRAQLLSRAGLTVFSVSSLLALLNVSLYPVLARAMGLESARALAFAARSVTIAFGTPVMTTMSGDAGLNAAMVVVAGILWQVGLGFVAGDKKGVEAAKGTETARSSLTLTEGEVGDVEAQVVRRQADAGERRDEKKDVAKGVMVGINAAAMGTAYLYEVGSEAAPYSALSMMALGIMTVVFASIHPLAGWVVTRMAEGF